MDEQRRVGIRKLIENHTRAVQAGTKGQALAELDRERLYRSGGIYQEVGPRGGKTPNYAATPGHQWKTISDSRGSEPPRRLKDE